MTSVYPSAVKAIQTRYAGCHFRSRLEARWAVFFDALGIQWEYEPQGYELSFRRYLPDFLLTSCGTFVEVRGSNDRVDLDELCAIAAELPEMPLGKNSYTRDEKTVTWSAERGPRLMLLGPIPHLDQQGDPGWLGSSGLVEFLDESGDVDFEERWSRYGFGCFEKNLRPWWLGNADLALDEPLSPSFDKYERTVEATYNAARSARFEHGQSGAA